MMITVPIGFIFDYVKNQCFEESKVLKFKDGFIFSDYLVIDILKYFIDLKFSGELYGYD